MADLNYLFNYDQAFLRMCNMIQCIMGHLNFVFAEGESCLVNCTTSQLVPDNRCGFIS